MYSDDPPPVFNLDVCESRTMINPQVARSLAGAAPRSFWLDQPDAPDPLPALTGRVTADLAIVGGGFCSASLTHGLANGYENTPAGSLAGPAAGTPASS